MPGAEGFIFESWVETLLQAVQLGMVVLDACLARFLPRCSGYLLLCPCLMPLEPECQILVILCLCHVWTVLSRLDCTETNRPNKLKLQLLRSYTRLALEEFHVLEVLLDVMMFVILIFVVVLCLWKIIYNSASAFAGPP